MVVPSGKGPVSYFDIPMGESEKKPSAIKATAAADS
jgi:hypothetical protein